MATFLDQVARVAERYNVITEQMADPEVAADFSRLNELDRERNEIEELAQTYRRYQDVAKQLEENQQLLEDSDDEMRELAQMELESLEGEREQLERTMKAGGGLGAKAVMTVTTATARIAPRTSPNAAPSRRSSQDSPTHLKTVERSLASNPPDTTTTANTMKNPSRFDAAGERRYSSSSEPGMR